MKKFNVGDVVTIKAYHYDSEYDKEYPIYNFCQIIDIKYDCYVLDLKYENEMGDHENILVSVFTNKSVNSCYDRYYQNYLKEKGFVDSIDDLDVYYFKLKEYIENNYTKVINQRLHDILQLYVKNMDAKTIMEISNAKDRIFLAFNDIAPIRSKANVFEGVRYNLYCIREHKLDIHRHYGFINKYLNEENSDNFHIDCRNFNIIGE